MPIKHKGKQTGRASSILENVVDNLHSLGFEIFNYPDWRYRQEENGLPKDYVIRSWPHQSLYGGRGKKEALLVTQRSRGVKFVREEDNNIRIILEAKYQSGSGSVDEKFPYVWESFLISDVPNWILLYDGRWWLEPRGVAAIKWLKDRNIKAVAEGNIQVRNKTFRILNRREFSELVGKAWR